jgi:soluble lytic murein transglycosylase
MMSCVLKRVLLLPLCLIMGMAAVSPGLYADIYMYIDEKGVFHFTDTPASPQYELFIKERKPKANKTPATANTYDHYIREASKTYGISAPLLKAVVKVESDFNPNAVSNMGAKGLMQIMPQNYGPLQINDPFNPRESIMGGARYLSQLLHRFNGNVKLALAAYNAGPDAVEQSRDIPPIQETKDYVKKIMRYYALFNEK